MIALDTSALMAIVLLEEEAGICTDVLDAARTVLISAGTLAEALIVAERRQVGFALRKMIEDLDLEVIPVTKESAYRASHLYQKWGKGVHSARLNYGDCFSCEVAISHHCPLLYVGNDFAQTDVSSAISRYKAETIRKPQQ